MDDRLKELLGDDATFLERLSALDRPAPAGTAPSPPTTPPDPARVRRPLLDLFPTPLEPAPEAPASHAPRNAALFPERNPPAAAPANVPPYAAFFGLDERPFSPGATDLKFLYRSGAFDAGAQALLAAIRRRDGVAVLTGEGGMGKTTLCRAVIEQLDHRTLTSLVSERIASPEDLLKTVLVDFGVISRADLEHGPRAPARAELSATLHGFLASLAPLQASAVVFVDEAQDLSAELLEQVRLLAPDSGDTPRLQIVLVGQPLLWATLERAELKPLADRVTTTCALGPLTRDEVAGYLAHRLNAAGADPRVTFEERAIERVFASSGGVPRLINLLCDRALSAAYGLSERRIDERLIESAATDLEIAPTQAAGIELRGLTLAAALLLLALAGASAGLYIFREDVAAILARWR